MTDGLHAFAERLATLTTPEALFGALSGDPATQTKTLAVLFKRFSRVTHEDVVPPEDRTVAHESFTKLNALYQEALARIASGKYGTATPTTPAVIQTEKATYEILSGLAGGDLATLYCARSGPTAPTVLVKLARVPVFNDLLRVESEALTTLSTTVASSYQRYVPRLLESNVIKIAGTPRRLNVLSFVPGYIPVTDLASYFPEGIDARHATWIFNRLLSVLGYAHTLRVVHGAVLPTHVLIHPESHGLLLVDWSYSVPLGRRVIAISAAYKEWYPPEVRSRQPATAATDIYMAAEICSYLLGGDRHALPASVPMPFQRFLQTCYWPNAAKRPQDAWALFDSFRETAKAMFGPRKFVELTLP